MTVKFDDRDFMKKFEKKKKAFISSVGHVAVNQAVQSSHVDTGLSRNAKHFITTTGESSNFGSEGGEIPTESLKADRPRTPDTIKVIAPLEYDIYLERRFGIMKRSLDLVRPQIRSLGKLIFKI